MEASSDKTTTSLRVKAGLGAAAAVLIIGAVLVAYIVSPAQRYEAAVSSGTEYAALQQYDLAIESFEAALEVEEDDLETRILLLESLAGAGDYDAVAAQLEESVVILTMEEYAQLEEAAVGLYAEGAGVSMASGDVDTAVELLERVLELAEEGSEEASYAEAQLADLYLTQAIETSLARFGAVLEKDPENLTALGMMAQLYDSLGDEEEALGYYERLAEAGGEDVDEDIARCLRSMASQRTGEAAIALWEESLTWDDESEEAYLTLAQLYLEQEDTQSAAAVLETGLSLVESEELQALYDELYVSEFEQLVIQIIESITTEDMTAEEKRLACYQYIIDTTTYVRTYEQPSGDWTKEYALDVLALQQGNCFRYAAAFAYMCAELGYDAKVCTGEVSAARGGTTPHGWVVLTIDGVEYLCDPDLEQSLGYDFYMKTYAEYPVKPLITEEEWEISFD